MSANDKQIGGTHYKINYECWDFVTDMDIPFLLATAIKYVSRWRNKTNVEDLRKAVHYLEKSKEKCVLNEMYLYDLTFKYCCQFHIDDHAIILHICNNSIDIAIKYLNNEISKHE